MALHLLRPSAEGELLDYDTGFGIINNTVWDLDETLEISKSTPFILNARKRCSLLLSVAAPELGAGDAGLRHTQPLDSWN